MLSISNPVILFAATAAYLASALAYRFMARAYESPDHRLVSRGYLLLVIVSFGLALIHLSELMLVWRP